jgi:hypothetical protein
VARRQVLSQDAINEIDNPPEEEDFFLARVFLDKMEPPARGAQAAILAIGLDECRWPIGEPGSAEFRFCCSPREQGAYCPRHAAAAKKRRK